MLATNKPSAWVAAMLAASLPRLDCKSNSPHLFVLARIGSARRTETEIDSTEPSLSLPTLTAGLHQMMHKMLGRRRRTFDVNNVPGRSH